MKIYTIKHENIEWDAYMGHVIVANNESQVRKIAKKISDQEGTNVWEIAKVKEIGYYTGNRTRPFILLSNYRAG